MLKKIEKKDEKQFMEEFRKKFGITEEDFSDKALKE